MSNDSNNQALTSLVTSKQDSSNPYTDNTLTGRVSSGNVGGSLIEPVASTQSIARDSFSSTPEDQCPLRWLEYPNLDKHHSLPTNKVLQYRTTVDGRYVWIDTPKVLFQDSVK